jgi:hypothetical protein
MKGKFNKKATSSKSTKNKAPIRGIWKGVDISDEQIRECSAFNLSCLNTTLSKEEIVEAVREGREARGKE